MHPLCRYRQILLLVMLIITGQPAHAQTATPPLRPASWARPLQLAGVPNLHQVSPTLYRSAQPSAEGMRNLKALGIKTILNLRSFHSDRQALAELGLDYEQIYMKTWHPETEDVVRFLRIVSDPERAPVLVHCQHGADRTGAMSALYRIMVQGWSQEEALREMTEGGYNFHEIWINLLPWLKGLDLARIRREAGLDSTPPPLLR